MRRFYYILLIIISAGNLAWGNTPDTTTTAQLPHHGSLFTLQWLALTSTGAGLTAIGTIANATQREWTPTTFPAKSTNIADIAQYAPVAFSWIMKACGSPTRSGWKNMAISHSASTVIMAATVSLVKDNHNSMRPDGSDLRSFPSGHTAWAYMGATWTARELGWRSPWYTMGAYSLASAIAMQRVIDHRHLPADVAAGAGIGILSAQIGYLIGDLIEGKHLASPIENITTSNNNRPALSLTNTISIPFQDIVIGNTTIRLSPAIEATLAYSLALSNHWSVAMSTSLRSTPIFCDSQKLSTFIAPLNSIALGIASEYKLRLSDIFSLNAGAELRYSHNLSLKSAERAIRIGKHSFGGIANIGATMRITENLDFGTVIGYEIKQIEASVSRCGTYAIDTHETQSDIITSLNLGLSTSIRF